MKKILPFMGFLVLLGMSANSQAFFGGSDYYDCPPWEYDCNPYDEWDPRYWMEEMEQAFDDDDDYYRYGGGPWGGMMPWGGRGYGPYGGYPGYGYGAPGYGYPQQPQPYGYGYQYQQPQQAPAPAPTPAR